MSKPDFFEFHLSYSDMELNPKNYLDSTYECGFVVHAPELFKESHLMDLATPNSEYRKYSMEQTQRVIDITRNLKAYFPKEKKPMIVANIGGFSMDKPIPKSKTKEYYKQFFESLMSISIFSFKSFSLLISTSSFIGSNGMIFSLFVDIF